MDPFLVGAASLALALGIAHSVLGERYILRRLFRRPLPPLFGSDDFTHRTLRFAWHILSVSWWGMAALLFALAAAPLDAGGRVALFAVSGTFAATALVTLALSQGRHWSWVVMVAIAVLTAVPALRL